MPWKCMIIFITYITRSNSNVIRFLIRLIWILFYRIDKAFNLLSDWVEGISLQMPTAENEIIHFKIKKRIKQYILSIHCIARINFTFKIRYTDIPLFGFYNDLVNIWLDLQVIKSVMKMLFQNNEYSEPYHYQLIWHQSILNIERASVNPIHWKLPILLFLMNFFLS